MKRKFLLVVLALITASFMTLTAACQTAKDRPPRPEKNEPTYKWKAFAGFGYTSLNQVNQAENGLLGVDFSLTRDFKKYFALTADGGYYAFTYSRSNPGNPKVDMALAGPELHVPLSDHLEGFTHMLLGGVHTAGDSTTPKVSFAIGAGLGLEYKFKGHFGVRLSGDDISSAFVQDPNHLGYSPHRRQNARVAFGAVYRF